MAIPTLKEVSDRIASYRSDPLGGLRTLRDQIAGEMAGLRENGVEPNHAELRTLADQIEVLLCPLSADQEAAKQASIERAANELADRAIRRAEELLLNAGREDARAVLTAS